MGWIVLSLLQLQIKIISSENKIQEKISTGKIQKNRGFDLWYVKEYVLGTKQNGLLVILGIHLDKKDATLVTYTCNGMDFGVLAAEYPWGQDPGIPNLRQSFFQRLTRLRKLAVNLRLFFGKEKNEKDWFYKLSNF